MAHGMPCYRLSIVIRLLCALQLALRLLLSRATQDYLPGNAASWHMSHNSAHTHTLGRYTHQPHTRIARRQHAKLQRFFIAVLLGCLTPKAFRNGFKLSGYREGRGAVAQWVKKGRSRGGAGQGRVLVRCLA